MKVSINHDAGHNYSGGSQVNCDVILKRVVMINTPIYLVPCDFSEVSGNALDLALEMARTNNGEIMLFRVIKNKADKALAKAKFQKIIEGLRFADRKIITFRVIIGNTYDEVCKEIEIIHPAMVVMGTHGAKGMQKTFGSHIEKIIMGSGSPLLITRGATHLEKMKTIVMPYSFDRESLQITSFAASMAKKFGATIHLVGIMTIMKFTRKRFLSIKRLWSSLWKKMRWISKSSICRCKKTSTVSCKIIQEVFMQM